MLELSATPGAIEDIIHRIRLDNEYRNRSISLVASENQPSPAVRAAEMVLAGSCYSFSPPFQAEDSEWFFPSNAGLDELMQRLTATLNRTFHVKWADPRPNGGSPCEHAIALGLLRRGDTLYHMAHESGGHFALEPICADAGIRVAHVVFDQRNLQIDPDATARQVNNDPTAKVVMIDLSFLLRQQPLRALRAALDERVLLAVDISHPMGLVIGGIFQQPALEGADIVHGNTHKTLFGPQKGWVGFNHKSPRVTLNDVVKPVCNKICPQLQSNCSTGSMVAMLVALQEALSYGHSYATQVVANARALAKHCAAFGLTVVGEQFGFTETHQVWLRTGEASATLALVRDRLNPAGIRTNNISLPGERGAHGLRLGTNVLTRRGYDEGDMEIVAGFLKRIILDKEPVTRTRSDVNEFLKRRPLAKLRYVLPPDQEAALIKEFTQGMVSPDVPSI